MHSAGDTPRPPALAADRGRVGLAVPPNGAPRLCAPCVSDGSPKRLSMPVRFLCVGRFPQAAPRVCVSDGSLKRLPAPVRVGRFLQTTPRACVSDGSSKRRPAVWLGGV
jgi:hypothetical protein